MSRSAALRDDRPRDVQRSVPDRRCGPGPGHHRRAQQRLGRCQHHPDERAAGLSAGGGGGAVTATPGTVAGQLERRVGDLVQARAERRARSAATATEKKDDKPKDALLVQFARSFGKLDDPTIRQDLMRLHTLNAVAGYNTQRVKAARSKGQDIPGMANIGKLQMSDVVRLSRDLGLRILGASGMLHAYTPSRSRRSTPPPATRSSPWSRTRRSMRRRRRSTAAPTRSRRTSSANESSACRRNPTTTRPSRSRAPEERLTPTRPRSRRYLRASTTTEAESESRSVRTVARGLEFGG
ncbi:MAG: hypothetical protein R2710_07690 [Acidimicrobiales bacterium]